MSKLNRLDPNMNSLSSPPPNEISLLPANTSLVPLLGTLLNEMVDCQFLLLQILYLKFMNSVNTSYWPGEVFGPDKGQRCISVISYCAEERIVSIKSNLILKNFTSNLHLIRTTWSNSLSWLSFFVPIIICKINSVFDVIAEEESPFVFWSCWICFPVPCKHLNSWNSYASTATATSPNFNMFYFVLIKIHDSLFSLRLFFFYKRRI